MDLISAVFLWSVYAIFKILKSRRWLASAIALLLAIPVNLFINFNLSGMISDLLIDVWDVLTFSILTAAAAAFLAIYFAVQKRQTEAASLPDTPSQKNFKLNV